MLPPLAGTPPATGVPSTAGPDPSLQGCLAFCMSLCVFVCTALWEAQSERPAGLSATAPSWQQPELGNACSPQHGLHRALLLQLHLQLYSLLFTLQDVIRGAENLDVQLAASGFQHKHQAALDELDQSDAETDSCSSDGAFGPDNAAAQHQLSDDAGSAASDVSSNSDLGTEDADQGRDHLDSASQAELVTGSQNVPRPGCRRQHPHDSADSDICSLSDSSLCEDGAVPQDPSDHQGLPANDPHSSASQKQLRSHAYKPGIPAWMHAACVH